MEHAHYIRLLNKTSLIAVFVLATVGLSLNETAAEVQSVRPSEFQIPSQAGAANVAAASNLSSSIGSQIGLTTIGTLSEAPSKSLSTPDIKVTGAEQVAVADAVTAAKDQADADQSGPDGKMATAIRTSIHNAQVNTARTQNQLAGVTDKNTGVSSGKIVFDNQPKQQSSDTSLTVQGDPRARSQRRSLLHRYLGKGAGIATGISALMASPGLLSAQEQGAKVMRIIVEATERVDPTQRDIHRFLNDALFFALTLAGLVAIYLLPHIVYTYKKNRTDKVLKKITRVII